jgi:hypothetical protein
VSRLGLRVLGLSRLLRFLDRRNSAVAAADAPRAVRWIPVAARYVPGGASCLVRSLALLGILHRFGAELRIGIGNTSPVLDAHAWVEVDGIPVNDSADVALRHPPFAQPLLRPRAVA